jgi:hypothetical protein
LSSFLGVTADLSGLLLESTASFVLTVDGTSVITFSDSVSAGPGQSFASPFFSPLSGTINLSPGNHTLAIELVTEQRAQTTASIPDQGGTLALLLIAAGSLTLMQRRFALEFS